MAAFMNVLRKEKVHAPRRECAESQYKQLYRFEEGNVEWMADHFLEHSGERTGGALTAKQQLQVLLATRVFKLAQVYACTYVQ